MESNAILFTATFSVLHMYMRWKVWEHAGCLTYRFVLLVAWGKISEKKERDSAGTEVGAHIISRKKWGVKNTFLHHCWVITMFLAQMPLWEIKSVLFWVSCGISIRGMNCNCVSLNLSLSRYGWNSASPVTLGHGAQNIHQRMHHEFHLRGHACVMCLKVENIHNDVIYFALTGKRNRSE